MFCKKYNKITTQQSSIRTTTTTKSLVTIYFKTIRNTPSSKHTYVKTNAKIKIKMREKKTFLANKDLNWPKQCSNNNSKTSLIPQSGRERADEGE